MSMARAFRYAGSPSILTSLWVVDDEAAFQMHVPYFQALKAGKAKDVAIQEARLAFLDQTVKFKAHPFFWASLIHIGNTEPIDIPKGPANLWYWLGALLLVAGIYVFVRTRRSR